MLIVGSNIIKNSEIQIFNPLLRDIFGGSGRLNAIRLFIVANQSYYWRYA